jgi:hypothetical protein
MPISTKINSELDLTVFEATGTVPFNEQMKVLKVFYEGSPTSNVIWDFTQVDEIKITSEELQKIVRYTKEHSALRQGGHTALVVNTKLKYGLARMASIYAEVEETPWDMQVFEDMDTAMAWISESK